MLREELLRQFKASGLSQRRFESKLGLKEWSLRGLLDENMKQVPSLDKAQEVAEALGLEFYIGPKRAAFSEHELVAEDLEYVKVDRFEVQLSAGPGSTPNGDAEKLSPVAFRAQWMAERRLKPATCSVVAVRGDSMEPGLSDGDLVLLDRGERPFVNSRVYGLVDIDGEIRVKRVEKVGGGQILLRSDNPTFETEVRGPEDARHVKIIGRVVWSAHPWEVS
ncbi:S24 family peptidase [Limimaricola variabilis]|uniref:LexA family transcriptional regulator n=1 Tax=Limimaricola variabilis TaxID=1492771 RepID=UPI002AC943F5|nr:S24 family peptidase [Limimaricola variabilis]WPY94712.1 S24 family peptidase [Limimaricola variabilis]